MKKYKVKVNLDTVSFFIKFTIYEKIGFTIKDIDMSKKFTIIGNHSFRTNDISSIEIK